MARQGLSESVLGQLRVFQELSNACVADDRLCVLLRERPRTILAGRGLEVGRDVDVVVVQNTAVLFHFVIPPNPVERLREELAEQLLSAPFGAVGLPAERAGGGRERYVPYATVSTASGVRAV